MPPHRGHQLMIETAQAQVDDLTILILKRLWPADPATHPAGS